MKILVIVAHPNFKDSKVNKGWVEELEKYEEITVHNLMEVYPDEQIDIKAEQELMLGFDRIVFQHPFYWYNVPYILKKWQDVVLQYGWAFGPGGDKLKGKECVSAISVGGPEISYHSGGYNSFTIDEFIKPAQQLANLTGMKFLRAFKVHEAVVISDEEIKISAKEYAKHILDPELNPEVALARITKEMKEKGTTL